MYSDMLIENIKKNHGLSALNWCALRDGGEGIIQKILEEIKPKVVVEIGTHHGLTTILLSKYADEVYTFDKQEFEILEEKDNVNYIICNNEEKKNHLESLDFDFAFIDGDHSISGVQFDFDCVKKCGCVLFHDYFKDNERPNINGSKPIVDKLIEDGENVTITNIFALWRAKC